MMAERNRTMIKFTYQIKHPHGMHARPAGKLATYAKQFGDEIRIIAGEKEADAKRLLALMSLGAKADAVLTVTVSGETEESTARQLQEYLEHSFGDRR